MNNIELSSSFLSTGKIPQYKTAGTKPSDYFPGGTDGITHETIAANDKIVFQAWLDRNMPWLIGGGVVLAIGTFFGIRHLAKSKKKKAA